VNRPQRPIFGFLWPRPDPHAPLDAAAVQQRLVRVAPRGPVRILTLIIATLLSVFSTSAAVMTALSAPMSGAALLASAVAATALYISLRGWVLGTYVNDHGIVLDTLVRRVRIPWNEVSEVHRAREPVPLLGMPLRTSGLRISIETTRGERFGTHVYTSSPDLVGRPDAFDMATDRLENWFRRA
jgi:hypothetical protein